MKKTNYELLLKQLQSVLEDETDVIANLSNASAVLKEGMDDLNWVGFYLMKNGELILGPFQGKVACVHIKVGKGVCGTAVSEEKTVLVGNVHDFPGHIACDCASNSEIVVPVRYNEKITGVLDIDSPSLDRFQIEDRENLEKAVKIISESCDWSSLNGYDF